jgi:hypothetical protein
MQSATEATLSTRFDPLSPQQREDPFALLATARREQPVFYATGVDLWVVTRHHDVLAVLKDHETFSSSGALKSAPLPEEVAAVLADGYRDMPYIIEVDPRCMIESAGWPPKHSRHAGSHRLSRRFAVSSMNSSVSYPKKGRLT